MINQRLDEQIDQKVDAYRNNPQQLAASYQKNQQLVDLLALQKLKSQKDAVARDMQMKAQNDPSTIKQQREQEMFQRTKQDMIKQTQGIMQNRQANQQKNLQRMMKAPQRPQPQRPQPQRPQPQGGLPAMMPKRPMPKMSGGGIVGFAPGGSTSLTDYISLGDTPDTGGRLGSAVIQRIRDLGLTQQQFQRLPQEQKDKIIQTIMDQSIAAKTGQATATLPAEFNDTFLKDPLKALGNIGIAALESRVGSALGLSDPLNPREPFEYNTSRKAVLDAMRKNVTPGGGITEAELLRYMPDTSQNYPPPGAPAINMNALQDAADQYKAQLPSTPQTPNYPNQAPVGGATLPVPSPTRASDLPQPELPSSDLSQYNTGIGGGSPMTALQQGLGVADLYTKRAEKDERLGDLIGKLEALEGDFNRKDEANDRFRASLAAAGGARNITDFAKQYVGTSQSMELAQKAARRSRLGEVLEAERKRIESDNTLAQQGLSLGQEMFAQAAQDRRTTQTNAAGMRNTDVRAALELSRQTLDKMKLDEDVRLKERDQTLKESELAIENARNEEMTKTRRSNDLSVALGKIDTIREKYYDTIYGNSEIPMLKMQAMTASGAEKQRLETEIVRQERIVSLAVEAALNDSNILQREQELFDAWSTLTGLPLSTDTVRR